MVSDCDVNEVLEATVAGIPAMANYVAALPDGQRAIALEALERHYLQTVQNLGGTEGPARTWVSTVMFHLKEQIEQLTEPRLRAFVGDRPKEDNSLAEEILSRATGVLALLLLSPLIAIIGVGLKLERSGPAIKMRKHGGTEAYQFLLGSGRVSRFVHLTGSQATLNLWHLLNGDKVLRFKDFAEIVRFPRSTRSGRAWPHRFRRITKGVFDRFRFG